MQDDAPADAVPPLPRRTHPGAALPPMLLRPPAPEGTTSAMRDIPVLLRVRARLVAPQEQPREQGPGMIDPR